MINFLNRSLNLYRGAYILPLFDPIQTHAVYGITDADIANLKKQLITLGAKRFRTVKIRKSDLRILCFNAKSIKSSV